MLNAARRVVASAPDFSWGWSAVTIAAGSAAFDADPGPSREEFRKEAVDAAAKAVELDPTNSEALAAQSRVGNPTDYVNQEALLKRAIAARPLECGCEHEEYAIMLQNVGRFADAAAEAARGVVRSGSAPTGWHSMWLSQQAWRVQSAGGSCPTSC